jgi:hypothetical protein
MNVSKVSDALEMDYGSWYVFLLTIPFLNLALPADSKARFLF